MSKAKREKRLDELNQKLGITHPDRLTEYDHQEMEEREWLKKKLGYASAVSEANGTTVPVSLAREFAFDTAVRRKPLAGAADAGCYGNSIDFCLKSLARRGLWPKR